MIQSDFLSLNLMSLFCSRTPKPILHFFLLSAQPPLDCDILRCSLLLVTLTVLRSHVRDFVECSSTWIHLMIFSWLHLGYGLGEESHKLKCHFHCTKVHGMGWALTFDVDFRHLPEVRFSNTNCSYCPFSITYSEKSHYVKPTLQGLGTMLLKYAAWII